MCILHIHKNDPILFTSSCSCLLLPVCYLIHVTSSITDMYVTCFCIRFATIVTIKKLKFFSGFNLLSKAWCLNVIKSYDPKETLKIQQVKIYSVRQQKPGKLTLYCSQCSMIWEGKVAKYCASVQELEPLLWYKCLVPQLFHIGRQWASSCRFQLRIIRLVPLSIWLIFIRQPYKVLIIIVIKFLHLNLTYAILST